MYIGLHVQYPLFFSEFNETCTFPSDFRKTLKFHENPSEGSRVAPRGCTDGQNDMTKVTLALRSFANAPKN
jgi:hypothetical protein